MAEPDPYSSGPLTDRVQMLAFEAELAYLPPSLITAIWEVIDTRPLTKEERPSALDNEL